MIVKNEADNLKLTLPGLVRSCDRVIIVDTGSTDTTKETAKQLGAEVYDFAWCDDFSAARNESIKHADSDWIAWFDADEYVEKEDLTKLREHLDSTNADIVHVLVKECAYGTKDAKNSYFRDKVFRNKKGFRFERPINEQVTASSASVNKTEKYEGIALYHWGRNLSEDKMARKNTERARIFENVAENNPSDPMYHYLLGMRYLDLNRFVEAEKCFDRVINICRNSKSIMRYIKEGSHMGKAWTFYRFEKYDKALAESLLAIECNPENAESYCVAAGSLLAQGKPSEAFFLMEKAVSLPKKQHPVLSNNDICWDVMRYMFYANCLVSEKRYKEAIPALEKVLLSQPQNENALNLLDLLKQGVNECKA